MLNPYSVLGVNRGMSDKEIAEVYKKLARQYHPDRCKDANATDRMAAITEAYQLIKTKELRDKYDKETSFSSDFGLFSSLFGKSSVAANFSKPPVDKKLQKHGRHIRKTLRLKQEELTQPGTISLKYVRKTSCLTCSGTGATKFRKCIKCGGNGKFRTIKRVGNTLKDIFIPCDVCNGTRLEKLNVCNICDGTGFSNKNVTINFAHDGKTMEYTFIGKGNSGINNGENGNLIVKLKEKK